MLRWSDDPSRHASVTAYREMLERFWAFTERRTFHQEWSELLVDRAEDEEIVVRPDVDLLALHSHLKTLLPQTRTGLRRDGAAIEISFESPVDDVIAYAESLSSSERSIFSIVLFRALCPQRALLTRRLDHFFEEDEIAALRARPQITQPLRPKRALPWAPRQDFDYVGYVCAIVKFTRLCNLRCTYCRDWRAGPDQTMGFDVQLALFSKLLGDDAHSQVQVVWHGGEVTLLGTKHIARVLALQEIFRRPGQRISNSIQTNATLVDDGFARFLARYGVRAGVSMDGPPDVHDRSRLHVSGRGSSEEVRAGLRRLRDRGVLDILLVVLTESVRAYGPARLLQFLVEERIERIGLLPVRPAGNEEVDREAYWRFLLELRDLAIREDRKLTIRELDAVERAHRGEMPGHCEMVGNCAGSYYTIEPDGRVGHCDKFIGVDGFIVGDVMSQEFEQIRNGPGVRQLREKHRVEIEAMRACPHFEQCRGWCPHERHVLGRTTNGHASCCGLAPVFHTMSTS